MNDSESEEEREEGMADAGEDSDDEVRQQGGGTAERRLLVLLPVHASRRTLYAIRIAHWGPPSCQTALPANPPMRGRSPSLRGARAAAPALATPTACRCTTFCA